MVAAFAAAVVVATGTPAVAAPVETGPWNSYSPGFTVQQRGCGVASGLNFQLTCSTASGDQRAERRYNTYSTGVRQFEGFFRINSMPGSRISLKQTFGPSGPFFMLAVERGGRLYAVEGGATLGSGATVGTSVRVNTVHNTGNGAHRVYINGSNRQQITGGGGGYYDKFGSYRTASGAGPVNVTWSGVSFWQR
jgi:hypothetical protein